MVFELFFNRETVQPKNCLNPLTKIACVGGVNGEEVGIVWSKREEGGMELNSTLSR